MKHTIWQFGGLIVLSALFAFGPIVSKAYAIDFGSFISSIRNRDTTPEAITLCVKNSGLVYVVGQGFQKADCKNNDRLISFDIAGVKGPTGSQGPTGTQGPTGIQGSAGGTGATGSQGPVGLEGPQGAQGIQGPQGAQGVEGPAGSSGTLGPQGPKGDQGIQGPEGPQGGVGATGQNGVQGSIGDTGATGEKGLMGGTGATGFGGPTGATGIQGPAGETGPVGATGIQGPIGATGAKGISSWEKILGELSPYNELQKDVIAICSTGKKVLGGGYLTEDVKNSNEIYVSYNGPIDDHTWKVIAGLDSNPSGDDSFAIRAVIICAEVQ